MAGFFPLCLLRPSGVKARPTAVTTARLGIAISVTGPLADGNWSRRPWGPSPTCAAARNFSVDCLCLLWYCLHSWIGLCSERGLANGSQWLSPVAMMAFNASCVFYDSLLAVRWRRSFADGFGHRPGASLIRISWRRNFICGECFYVFESEACGVLSGGLWRLCRWSFLDCGNLVGVVFASPYVLECP
jgi:hypothetical protein